MNRLFSAARSQFLPAALALAALAGASAVQAQKPATGLVGYEYRKVEQQLSAKNYAAALDLADRHLQANPRDPQMRMLKSRILQAQGKSEEAFALLQNLTQEFPEIPEPYNNLAAMQAQRGDIEAARLSLETALKLNPSYTTALENLGDIYRRMAHDTYQRALATQPGNASLRAKVDSTAR